MTDTDYMRRALVLAAKGQGQTHPNPMVGAVAVQHGVIIGEGYHPGPGKPHAEVFALQTVSDGTPDVTVYVTLEPCAFYGRTPPCADLLVKKGVSRVVCAMPDPDKRVSGRGFEILQAAGIGVDVGLLEDEARHLNEPYIKHRTTGLPFVTLKLAQSIDGCIATLSGDSKWITSEASRVRGHVLRAEVDAILTGIGTVRVDDPELSVRHVAGKSPAKIVLDSQLAISTKARVFNGAPLFLATGDGVSEDRLLACESVGAKIWRLPATGGWPELKRVLEKAADAGFLHVLIEGGRTVTASALREGLVDRIVVFIAPKILGAGLSSVGDLGIDRVASALNLFHIDIERLGDDVVYSARIRKL